MSKRWVLISHLTGTYVPRKFDSEEEPKQTIGCSLYLGIGTGDTPEEALGELAGRHSLRVHLPDIEHANLIAYEVVGNGVDLDIEKAENSYDKITDPKIKGKITVTSGEKCKWCTQELSTSSAAQYSHLKKHVSQMIKAKFLTQEQAREIRGIKLSPEMIEIFKQAVTQKIFKE
jgi:hypothetical protein